MGNSVLLKCKGLYTFPNRLGELPPGSLLKAINVVINREGIIESRRGFAIYGNAMGSGSTDVAKQLLTYKGRILRHYGSTLQFDNGSGTFTSFTGTNAETTTGLRIKGLEVNGNFYYTTAAGVKKISVAAASGLSAGLVTSAGGIRALDTELTLNSDTGFFVQDSTVAYRVVWGIKDSNNNVILGFPSERAVITNSISDLLISDFNALLVNLDGVSNSGGINDANYVTSLKVPRNSSASTLRTNIIALATKIDNDTIITEGTIETVSHQRVSATSGKIVFDENVSTFLSIGDKVNFTALTEAEMNNNVGTITALSTTSVANDTIAFTPTTNYGGTDGAPVADVVGVCKRVKYTLITAPVALSTTPTTAQLEDLQTYYDAIVTLLQSEPAGIITTNTPFDDNVSTQSASVDVKFTIPSGITTTWFYQIYRTELSTSTGVSTLSDFDPGDEQKLVYEANPTSGEISAGTITVQDIVPESFLGANLYTNPVSGDGRGILDGNEVPPLCKDIAPYKNFTFYANTETKQRKNLSLLSVTDMISATSTLTITDSVTSKTYTFVSPVAEVSTFTSVADVANSLNGTYFLINSAEDARQYYVWFKTSAGAVSDPAVAGRTGIRVNITTGDTANTVAGLVRAKLNQYDDFTITGATNQIIITNSEAGISTNNAVGTSGFAVVINTNGTGEDATNRKILLSNADTPSQQVDETARSLQRVVNKDATSLVYCFYLSGPDDVPGLMLLESRTLGASAFYLNVNSTATGDEFSPSLPTSGNAEISSNEVSPNRIYFSKNGQPEAVPIVNYQDIGPRDKQILRIIGLRDSLFVLKEEGIYRLSGEVGPFSVSLMDSSANLKAPDSAAVLNNQIFMFSDQGITKVSENGVEIVSHKIEDLLIKLMGYTNFDTVTHGQAYESDRSYYLHTVSKSTDTKATQCFKYNSFSDTWTVLDISKTCGVVNPADDKYYLGASDTNFIEQERKSFDRTDHADRELPSTLDDGAMASTSIVLGDVSDFEIGDVIVQTQYLTINQFNRLLKKLDLDNGVTDTNYYSLLGASAGNNLRTKLTSLATKLDADAGVTDTNYAATIIAYTSSFADQQTAFNAIVSKLNLDATVSFNNYGSSSSTVIQEVIITNINRGSNTITVNYAYPLIVGAISIFKHFNAEVVWAPYFMEDPSMSKHVREATILFENTSFTNAIAAFSSDLSPHFEENPFVGDGNGAFGSGIFGSTVTFGGLGTSKPYRTLIPRNKQRCRYLNYQFKHQIAREKFSIYGISAVYEPVSSRAYK